jgi:hypothetical protein
MGKNYPRNRLQTAWLLSAWAAHLCIHTTANISLIHNHPSNYYKHSLSPRGHHLTNQWRTQEFFFGGISKNSVEGKGQRERGSGGDSPLVRSSTQFAMNETHILITLLWMYIPRIWEFGSALSKLRNFVRGGVWTPKPPPPRYAAVTNYINEQLVWILGYTLYNIHDICSYETSPVPIH